MDKTQNERLTNVYLALGTFAFVGLVALYVLEFPYFSNTLQVVSLVKKAVLIGLVSGVIFLVGGWATGALKKESVRLHVFFLFAWVVFAPFFASFTNRKLARSTPYSTTFEYLGQKAYYTALFGKDKDQPADTYWLYLRKNGKNFAFRTFGTLPMNQQTGDSVRLILREGFWGYDFFDGKSWEFF